MQYNAELDYGQQQNAAYNGGQAQWYGLSLLAHRKFNLPAVGRMGATLRYDLLVDSKNGGGGGGIALNSNGMDTADGFGIGADCLANSKANGGLASSARAPPTRTSRSTAVLPDPADHGEGGIPTRLGQPEQVFLKNDGSYSKSNDMLATQFIYSF